MFIIFGLHCQAYYPMSKCAFLRKSLLKGKMQEHSARTLSHSSPIWSGAWVVKCLFPGAKSGWMRRHGSQPAFPRAPSVHYTVVINWIKLLLIMADVLNTYSWEADSNKCNEELIIITTKLWQKGTKIKVNTLDIILYLKLACFLHFII